MAMTWDEVTKTPDYQKSDTVTRENMRNGYFMDVVVPQIPVEYLDAARADFDNDTAPSAWKSIKEAVGAASTPNDQPASAKPEASRGVTVEPALNQKADNFVSNAYDRAIDKKYLQLVDEKANPVEPATKQAQEGMQFVDRSAELDAQRRLEADNVQQAVDTLSGKRKHDGADNMANVILNQGKDEAARVAGLQSESDKLKAARIGNLDYRNPEDRAVIDHEMQRTFANSNPVVSDSATDFKSGVAKVPGAFVGLIDIAPALVFGKRPADKLFNDIADVTGFHPEQYAQKLEHAYSDIRKQGKADITATWDDETKTWWDVTKAYANNPGVTAGTVIQSLPAMAAGGAVARVVMLRNAGLAPAAMQKAQVTAGAIGEGSMMAGQQMNDINRAVDPRVAALASLATGVAGAAIGKYSGAMASKLGIRDVDTLLAGGSPAAVVAMPFYKRIPAAMVQEGIIEEGFQTSMETMLKNIAENKPVMEGVNRATIEGILAGSAMGGTVAIPGGGASADGSTQPPPRVQQPAALSPAGVPTGATPASEILGTPEQPADPYPNAAPGSLKSAANIAAQQGITPINQPEVANAQVQPGVANEQPDISPTGSDTNVLLSSPTSGGGNAVAGNGDTALGGGLAATGTGESGGTARTDAGLLAAQPADNVALPAFSDPHELRTNEFIKTAQAHGVSPEIAAKIAPPHIPENVTGFYKAEDKDPTVARAQEFVAQTGKQAHFVDADIANLGGLNAHFKNNHAPANAVYRAFSDIFQEELQKLGGKVIPFRHGGDEFSAVVLGSTAEAVRKASEAASARIKDYAISQGLDKIEHPKHPGSLQHRGVGVYFGQAAIRPGVHLKQIFAESAASIDAGKTGGLYVSREQGSPQAVSGAVQGERSGVSKSDTGVRPAAESENRSVQRAGQPAVQGTKNPAGNSAQSGNGENAGGNSPDTRAGRGAQGEGVSTELQGALESLIRSRKTAGQFGLAPNLDAVIQATKVYLKGGKFNAALLKKTAAKFQRHDAGIATTIRGVIDTVSQGKKAGPKVSKPSNDLIQRIKQLGGISSEYAEDFGAKDAKFNIKSAFKQGGQSPDFIASQLKDEGYPLSEDDLIGGLSEFVRRYINGERSFKHVDAEAAAMSMRDDLAFQELIPDAEKHGIDWRKFKSPDDLYIEITKAEDAKIDAEEAALDVVLGDPDITLDDLPQATAAETNAWLQGEDDARGHTESTAGTATGEPVTGNQDGAQGAGVQGEAQGFNLEGQTNAEIEQQEQARRAALDADVRAAGEAGRAERAQATQQTQESNVKSGAAAAAFSLSQTEPVSKSEQKKADKAKAQAELSGQPDIFSQPAIKSEPDTPAAPLADALEKYEGSGEIATADDLANEVERLIDEGQVPGKLQDAIETYRDELADNHEMAGRGDMDSAEEALISAIRAATAPAKKQTGDKLKNATAPEHVETGEAGVTVQELNDAVEDFYYQDLDDNAANSAISALIKSKAPAESTTNTRVEKLTTSTIIALKEIPVALKIPNPATGKGKFNARKQMLLANQNVEKLEALKLCMRG